MPSSNGLASFFHFGAKTWRPKTAEQSHLEFEKRKHAEEVARKQSELRRRIELLGHIRKLESKTQALNQMALSAEIETKEHELAMRERQMIESRQIELAKLELAKRMGQESLDEADLSRTRRERIKDELLAHASSSHAMNELNRTAGRSEIDSPVTSNMPQPPPFIPPETFISPHPGQTSMAGPIPIRGLAPMSDPYGSIPNTDPRFMSPSKSTPGNMHMPPRRQHSIFNLHGSIPSGPALHSRRISHSFSSYPGDFDRGSGGFDLGLDNFHRGSVDFERGRRVPSRNMFSEPHCLPSNHFDPHQMHPSNNSILELHEPIDTQMALRAQAERLWRKRLEHLDQKARRHDLNAAALREIRKRELIANLRERGAHQQEIEAQAAKLAEHDHRLNESQLRELRDKEYHIILKSNGLQEREIAEQLGRRDESDREILPKELQGLERELRRKEILEAEWAIRRALEKGEDPPMGVTRPSIEEIKREGLLNDYMDRFHDLNPRLQHEILSISAHHRPHSRMSSMNEIDRTRSPRAHTPGSSRASGRADDYEPVFRSASRPHSLRESNNADPVMHPPLHQPSVRSLAANDPDLHFHHSQSGPSNEYHCSNMERASRNEASLHDATLAARLQNAAVNSEINGGRRSRASSNASQALDDCLPSSRHRPGGDLNSFNSKGEGRSRSSTNPDILRSHKNLSSLESAGGQRFRKNGIPFETGPHIRSNNEYSSHFGIGRSPLGSNEEFHKSKDARQTINSTPKSQAQESSSLYDQPHGLNYEELSHLGTEEAELLLGGYGLELPIDQSNINTKNLTQAEIERMSAEEFDAILAQHQASLLTTGMSYLSIASSQSHKVGGLPRHPSVSGTQSSSSPLRQFSLGRVNSESSRSLSRGRTSSSHRSVPSRQGSRAASRPATALDRPNDRPPSAPRSLHRNSDQYILAGGHQNHNTHRDGSTRNSVNSICHSLNHQADEDLSEYDVTVTEMKEHPDATIIERLAKIRVNSRRNLKHCQQIDPEREMHQAVKNLIVEASRSGANGIVSLRIHELEDGSYDASGEAVFLIQR